MNWISLNLACAALYHDQEFIKPMLNIMHPFLLENLKNEIVNLVL